MWTFVNNTKWLFDIQNNVNYNLICSINSFLICFIIVNVFINHFYLNLRKICALSLGMLIFWNMGSHVDCAFLGLLLIVSKQNPTKGRRLYPCCLYDGMAWLDKNVGDLRGEIVISWILYNKEGMRSSNCYDDFKVLQL